MRLLECLATVFGLWQEPVADEKEPATIGGSIWKGSPVQEWTLGEGPSFKAHSGGVFVGNPSSLSPTELQRLRNLSRGGRTKITGELRYLDRAMDPAHATVERPVRYVEVRIYAEKRGWGGEYIGTGLTDGLGRFSITVDRSWLAAAREVEIHFAAANYAASVNYAIAGNVSSPYNFVIPIPASLRHSPGLVVALPPQVITDSTQSLNILHGLTLATEYAMENRGDVDVLPSVRALYPAPLVGALGNYDDASQVISILGVDSRGLDHGFDDASILHEFGHHLTATISSDLFHADPAQNGKYRAWSQGFADYFSNAVRFYRRSEFDERPRFYASGNPPDPAAIVANTLLGIHDGVAATHPHDYIDGLMIVGASRLPIFRILFQIVDHDVDNLFYEPSLDGFHDAWVARDLYPRSHSDLDRILVAEGYELDHGLPEYAAGFAYMRRPGAIPPFEAGPFHAGEAYELTMYFAHNQQNPYPNLTPLVHVYYSKPLTPYRFLLWSGPLAVSGSASQVVLPSGVPVSAPLGWTFLEMKVAVTFSHYGYYRIEFAIDREIWNCTDWKCGDLIMESNNNDNKGCLNALPPPAAASPGLTLDQSLTPPTIGPGDVTLQWLPVDASTGCASVFGVHKDVTKYRVSVWGPIGNWQSYDVGLATTLTLTNLAPGFVYGWHVEAWNAYGPGQSTEQRYFQTPRP